MKYNFYFLRLLLLSPWPWDTSEDFLFSFLSSFWSFFWAVRFIDFLWRSVVRDLPEDDGRPNLAEHQGRFHGWRNLSHFSRISTAQSRHQMGESPPAPSPVHSISCQNTPLSCQSSHKCFLWETFLPRRRNVSLSLSPFLSTMSSSWMTELSCWKSNPNHYWKLTNQLVEY